MVSEQPILLAAAAAGFTDAKPAEACCPAAAQLCTLPAVAAPLGPRRLWPLALATLLWACAGLPQAAAAETSGCPSGRDGLRKLKVACIGASITKGNVRIPSGIASDKPYPQQLEELLGPGYCVENFGIPGATVLKESRRPYWHYHNTIAQIKALKPDVIVMQFGANDSKERNVHADFQKDYRALIKLFQGIHSRPEVYIMAAPPIYSCTPRGDHIYGMDAGIANGLQGQLEHITKGTDILPPISVFEAFRHHCPDMSRACSWMAPDGVHPNVQGDQAMAGLVYTAIDGSSSCTVPAPDRKDCGFQHITEKQCLQKGCCYRPSAMDGTPWCFHQGHPQQHRPQQCAALNEQKTDCGATATGKECHSRGCCWQDSSDGRTPQCFRPLPERLLERSTSTSTGTLTTTSATSTSTITTQTMTVTPRPTITITTTTTTTTIKPMLIPVALLMNVGQRYQGPLSLAGACLVTLLSCCAVKKCCEAWRRCQKQCNQEGTRIVQTTTPDDGSAPPQRSGQWRRARPADFMEESIPETTPLMFGQNHSAPALLHASPFARGQSQESLSAPILRPSSPYGQRPDALPPVIRPSSPHGRDALPSLGPASPVAQNQDSMPVPVQRPTSPRWNNSAIEEKTSNSEVPTSADGLESSNYAEAALPETTGTCASEVEDECPSKVHSQAEITVAMPEPEVPGGGGGGVIQSTPGSPHSPAPVSPIQAQVETVPPDESQEMASAAE